jgi:ribosomal protein S18 acetylase RimI-like enzyme
LIELVFTNAEQASVEAFLRVSAGSPHQSELEEYLHGLLRQRCTRLEWCLIALEAAKPIARAALWAPPGHEMPTDFVLIETDWSADDLGAAPALLAHLHERAAALGADALAHVVDSPPVAPQYQAHEDARIRLLEDAGYELLRDGLRWRRSPAEPEAAQEASPLTFRPLPDVGEAAFVEAIAATLVGTADSALLDDIRGQGESGAARQYYDDMQVLTYEPEWWELGFTADGALAGVTMAGRNPTSAVIAYIGVVPEQRGRGFAAQLVERGTMHLARSGADEIRGDCDRDNPAMVKAFERAGYEQFARRRAFRRSLAEQGPPA